MDMWIIKYKCCKLSDLLLMQGSATESQILEEYINEREREESEQLRAKRRFLKENILDVYIREEQLIDQFLDFFLLYLKNRKGIDTRDHNLELLSLPELKELVAEFRTMHPSAEQTSVQEVQNTIDVSLSRISAEKEPQFDAHKVYYMQSNGSWDYELQGYEECKRVKPFFAVEDGYHNNVVIFEKQEIRKVGGFFGIGAKSELWIQFRSTLVKEHTLRRIQDFISLRKLLSKAFPFSFIYPLNITQKQLQRVSDETTRTGMVTECRKFINFVCKNEQLLQCFYTHRFFKENNFQTFVNAHKEESKEANRIKMLQNSEGCVQIQISDTNQMLKKDYTRKSDLLQQIWTKFNQSNTRITTKLREVQAQIQKQRKLLEKTILQFTNINPLIKSTTYDAVTSIFVAYNMLFKHQEQSLNDFHFLFQSLNLQITSHAKNTWAYFSKYAKEITSLSEEYHARRKVFLQKEVKRVEQATKGGVQGGEGKQQLDPVNRSIISNLGISSNSVKETVWIQRFSKWQGYMNLQFTASFERLLQLDIDTLRNILRENVVNRTEMQRKEEALIKSLQTFL